MCSVSVALRGAVGGTVISTRSVPVTVSYDTPLHWPPKPTSLDPTVVPDHVPVRPGRPGKHWGRKLRVREGVAVGVGVISPKLQLRFQLPAAAL